MPRTQLHIYTGRSIVCLRHHRAAREPFFDVVFVVVCFFHLHSQCRIVSRRRHIIAQTWSSRCSFSLNARPAATYITPLLCELCFAHFLSQHFFALTLPLSLSVELRSFRSFGTSVTERVCLSHEFDAISRIHFAIECLSFSFYCEYGARCVFVCVCFSLSSSPELELSASCLCNNNSSCDTIKYVFATVTFRATNKNCNKNGMENV